MGMWKYIVISSLLVATVGIVGCKTNDTKSSTALVTLCSKCGQIKGTDVCCKAGQPKCETCGLAKGSPGCCKLPEDVSTPVQLCAECGEIKGGEKCCEPVATCGKCRLNKGAPGCCKMDVFGK